MDLTSSKPEWKSVPQPFKRRALIAAAFAGRLYVMGGFDDKGKVVKEVSIYDPESGAWSKGPDLPGNGIDGFAPAACVHDGELYVSVADGTLYRLDQSGLVWEKASTATPRVAHRLASNGKTILVIGGANDGRNSDLIESVAAKD
jgi:N-acetylneuraminic acid mutarotase